MRVNLMPRYRILMCLFVPSTLGFGTAALWARSLSWPHAIDAEALTLRSRRKIAWKEIRAITVHRSYVDRQIFDLDIQAAGSKWRVPIRALEDGQRVAATIIAMFKQTRRAKAKESGTNSAHDAPFVRPPNLQPPRYASETTHAAA
jgi:hypothetical protein